MTWVQNGMEHPALRRNGILNHGVKKTVFDYRGKSFEYEQLGAWRRQCLEGGRIDRRWDHSHGTAARCFCNTGSRRRNQRTGANPEKVEACPGGPEWHRYSEVVVNVTLPPITGLSVLTHDFSKAVKQAVYKVLKKNFVARNSYTKTANTLK